MKPWEWDSEKLRKMFKEKSPNPSVEQMAWTTMVIGLLAPIIHRKPKWPGLEKAANYTIIARALRQAYSKGRIR